MGLLQKANKAFKKRKKYKKPKNQQKSKFDSRNDFHDHLATSTNIRLVRQYCMFINFIPFDYIRRRLLYSDLNNIAPEHYTKSITARLTDIQAVSHPDDRGIFIQVLESAYRFSLGSFAGGKTIHFNFIKIFSSCKNGFSYKRTYGRIILIYRIYVYV